MKVSIIVPDGVVRIDEVPRPVSMSGVDPDLHAVQWNGSSGEVEYGPPRNQNERITSLAAFQFLIDRWNAYIPPPPPAPPTKDELIALTFGNPVIRIALVELARRAGIADETTLKNFIKSQLP